MMHFEAATAKKIQTFELEDGSTVAVEVAASPGEEERISSAREEVVEETGRRFSQALSGV